MAIIQREDGTQFVLRCYRETLSLSNTTLFKQHAFLISEMHGYFAKFFSGKTNRQVESVFSNDAGYILAEMVWRHLGSPNNMIFCEALENKNYICITVRDGIIFSDGEFNDEELREELATTISMADTTVIYSYGNIPGLTVTEDNTSTAIPNLNKQNIKLLENSLINNIDPAPEFELVPIQQAISDLQLSKASKRKVAMTFATTIFLLITLVSYFVYHIATKPPPPEQVDPLIGFKTALGSPSPSQKLQEAINGFILANSIPGWQLVQSDIKGNQLSGTLNSYGGEAVYLLDWAKANHASVSFGQKGAQLELPLGNLPNRLAPTTPLSLSQTTAVLIDHLIAIAPSKVLSLGATTSLGAYSKLDATINLDKTTPGVILLLGSVLDALPLNVDDVTLSSTTDSLIVGSIKITLYGN